VIAYLRLINRQVDLEYPIVFKLTYTLNEREQNIYLGVQEFTAPLQYSVYLPMYTCYYAKLAHMSKVKLTYINPVKCTDITVQAHHEKFNDMVDHKQVLESNIKKHYPVLYRGQTIRVFYFDETYEINIVNCKPENVIRMTDTDVNVEFLPPIEKKEVIEEEKDEIIPYDDNEEEEEESEYEGWGSIEKEEDDLKSKWGKGYSLQY
jgi:hypothetical protein